MRNKIPALFTHFLLQKCNQMGREVLEGLRVYQSQQRPLSRKINKRIIAHPVITSQHCLPVWFEGAVSPPVQCSNTVLKMRNEKFLHTPALSENSTLVLHK